VRKKVAREAAILLYTSQEKEFKQAKLKAAEALGTRILPSNLEVAVELDQVADGYEGQQRSKRLIQMRKEGLRIMKCLRSLNPKLKGSVWRGTTHRNSDIDITVFSLNSEGVVNKLRRSGFKIVNQERTSKVTNGDLEESLHIYVHLPSSNEAEIVVRLPEKMGQEETCEIYGDPVKGLSITQLEGVIKEDPTRRFLPDRAKT
jgi:predicted nucleotidyltransferase